MQATHKNPINATTLQRSSLLKTEDGFTFRDLNKNGKLDIYEDPRQPIEARVEDLLRQMTLEEKAGTMFIHGSEVNEDSSIEAKPDAAPHALVASRQMTNQKLNHFNLWAFREQRS